MATRGPQRRLQVQVEDETGQHLASATCFFSAWTDEASGERRWRGFLSFIEPPGSVGPGAYRIRLPSGGVAVIAVSEQRTEGTREQAVFVGQGLPPSLEEETG
ncbi:MAG: hypothetical protein ACE5IZ_06070 [Dehalococcoidia bacterium]